MKRFLLSLSLVFMIPIINAQVCVPGTLTAPLSGYIIPDSATNFANACPGTYYEQILYVKAPKDTTLTLTTPISGVVNSDIDSFVINAAIGSLPSYLTVESVPAPLNPAGSSLPKSDFKRMLVPGDSLACVKIHGIVPPGTPAGTVNLSISLRVYTSNITSPNPAINLLIPTFYPGRKTDTLASLNYYKIEVFPTPCWPTAVNNINQTDFELIGILPNPVSTEGVLKFTNSSSSDYQFVVYNCLGEPIIQRSFRSIAGLNAIPVSLQQLPNGIYFYTLSSPQQRVSKKLEVLR